MRQCVTRGGPFWEAHAWRLHHINAPDRTALIIGQFFAERNIATLEYPPYFLDLAPCDFFLFPKIKSVLKRTHFFDIDSIKMAATTELKMIPENVFQDFIESWKRRMHKCFEVEGNYFEGIWLWYISIFFNKVFITPVSLLFGHTSYILDSFRDGWYRDTYSNPEQSKLHYTFVSTLLSLLL